MTVQRQDQEHQSISERWQALDDYFICITECDLNDQNCITSCLVNHLKIDDGSDTSEAA